MATFRIGPDGIATYGNVSLQWRAVAPVSEGSLHRSLRSGDATALVEALGNASLPLSRKSESLLASRLGQTMNAELIATAALKLSVGHLERSVRALADRYAAMLARNEYIAALEVSSSLFRRGDAGYFGRLVKHVASRLSQIEVGLLAFIVGLSALRHLPLKTWPKKVIATIASHPSGRAAAARVFLAKKDPEGRRMIREALAGGEGEREWAIIATGATPSRAATTVLRMAFESEESPRLRLLCAEYLRGALKPGTRMSLILNAISNPSPWIRYQAARQIEWLPGKRRKEFARTWLESEADEVVKSRISIWL